MPKLRNGSKGGFEPGLSRLRVRRSTAALPRSTRKVDNITDDIRINGRAGTMVHHRRIL